MMGNTIHILLIEDDLAHAELIQRAFEDWGDEAKLTIAHSCINFMNNLSQNNSMLHSLINIWITII